MKNTITRYFSLLPCLLLLACEGNSQEPTVLETAEPVLAVLSTGVEKTPSFLFLSDIHLNHEAKDTPHKDDTGTTLWSATKTRLQTMMTSADAPKFIIYTGDLTAHQHQHSGESFPQSELDTNMAIVLNDLYEIAGTTPLFYAPGNNDALEGDYANFANYAGKTPFSLVDSARMNYPAPNATMVSYPKPGRGYYSARPFPGLRVIALNSVTLGHEHWTATAQRDYIPYGDTMMQWLTNELIDVKNTGEKAYLIMHIPPGIDAYSHRANKDMWDRQDNGRWEATFLKLADQHQDDIAGIFYGHTHMDEIRLLTKPGTAGAVVTEVAISSPGISPNHGQNPAFKTVSYSSTDYEPIDFTTYYTDQYNATWDANDTYTFTGKYGLNNISELTGKLDKQKFNIAANGLRETYKAGKGRSSDTPVKALVVE